MNRFQSFSSVILLISFAGGLTGCATIQRWQQNLGEKRHFQTREMWVRQTTEKDLLAFRKINRMKPILFNDKVIDGNSHDGIAAYNQTSGQEIWRLHVNYGVEASGTLIHNRLFFGANDGQFYSVDANTGQVLWTFPVRMEVLSEPLLDNGVIYILVGNNTLYALDAATGKQLWLYSRQDSSSLSVRGGSKPAIRNGTLYVGFSDGALVALLAQTGTVKWEKQLSRNKKFRDLDSDPLIEGDFLYVLGFDDHVYCLRTATGELVWKGERGGFGAPLLIGQTLYYATTTSEFVALKRDTGELRWKYKLTEGIATSPSAYKGLIVFGESQGQLRFLDQGTGRLVASFEPGRGIFSPPLINEKTDTAYFISGEANLYALKIGWTFEDHLPYLR